MNLKVLLFACVLSAGAAGAALAQSDMSCADFNKTFDSLDAASKDALLKNQSEEDKKLAAYCAKNPSAKVSEAMEKALGN